MGLSNVTKMLALASPPSVRPTSQPSMPPRPTPPLPADVVVLKHCRCMDCRNFSREGREYFCSEHIGGTSVVWATGQRACDPLPDAWHYCACYHGPQVSTDVWLWPRTTAHVGPRSTISGETEQPAKDAVGA